MWADSTGCWIRVLWLTQEETLRLHDVSIPILMGTNKKDMNTIREEIKSACQFIRDPEYKIWWPLCRCVKRSGMSEMEVLQGCWVCADDALFSWSGRWLPPQVNSRTTNNPGAQLCFTVSPGLTFLSVWEGKKVGSDLCSKAAEESPAVYLYTFQWVLFISFIPNCATSRIAPLRSSRKLLTSLGYYIIKGLGTHMCIAISVATVKLFMTLLLLPASLGK